MRYFLVIPLLGMIGFAGCGSDDGAPSNAEEAAGAPVESGAGGGGGSGTTAGEAGGGSIGGGGGGGMAPMGTGGNAGRAATGGAAGGGGTGNVMPPPTKWTNSTGNLANMASECGNLGHVSADPTSDMVVAGVAQKGLWSTHDGGKTWAQLGTSPGSAKITNRISTLVWDPDHPGTFWESGIYNGGGVYETTDAGVTFKQLGTVAHNDSVSVDLVDPARKTLLAGPHEASSKMFRSTDSGATWTDIGSALQGSAGFCTAALVLDSKTFLVGCTGGGIMRSTDGGSSFSRLGTKGVIAQPRWAKDKSIYWSGSQGGVLKSKDQGLTFTQSADSNVAASVVPPTAIAELPDGRIVVIGKDHLQMTADGGQTWKPIGDPLPFNGGGFDGASGVAYSGKTKTFFIWRWTCGNTVPADAIMSSGFDYTQN